MPFKSQSQAQHMFSVNPALAKEFAQKTKSIKRLPEKVEKKESPKKEKREKSEKKESYA